MKVLQESLLKVMDFKRLKEHRKSVLAHIRSREFKYCCDRKCEMIALDYPTKDNDYKYLNLVNRYYNAAMPRK